LLSFEGKVYAHQEEKENHRESISVADPDLGSGAFLTPGSGIPDPE
jgi:hypothetical protein